jgi:hypothetical protein
MGEISEESEWFRRETEAGKKISQLENFDQ